MKCFDKHYTRKTPVFWTIKNLGHPHKRQLFATLLAYKRKNAKINIGMIM